MSLPDDVGLLPDHLVREVLEFDVSRKSASLEKPWNMARGRKMLQELLAENWSPIQLNPNTGHVISRLEPGSPQASALGCGVISDPIDCTVALSRPTLVATVQDSIKTMARCPTWAARAGVFRNFEVFLVVGRLQCITLH